MIKKLLFVLCTTFIVAFSCDSGKTLGESLLINNWTHSYEEDINGINTFRPTNSQNFDASRYRFVLNLKDNNSAEYLKLAPNDGHYLERGKWNYNNETEQLFVFNDDGDIIYAYKVIKVTRKLLQLKPIAS